MLYLGIGIHAQHVRQSLVESFGESIGLGMVSGGELVFGPEEIQGFFDHLGLEYFFSITILYFLYPRDSVLAIIYLTMNLATCSIFPLGSALVSTQRVA